MVKKYLRHAGYLLYLLVVIELSLQAFYYFNSGSFLFKRFAVPIFRIDQDMGWSVKPNLDFHHVTNEFNVYIYTNSQGFRTSQLREEYSPAKEASRFRILLLGPSFAFGWGVNYEDTFAHHLTTYLETGGFARGRKIELINSGIPYMGPPKQLPWFDRHGKKFSPDLVVQFIYGSMYYHDTPVTMRVTSTGYLLDDSAGPSKRLQAVLKNVAIVYYGWVAYTQLASRAQQADKDKRIIGAGRDLEERTQFSLNKPEIRTSVDWYERLRTSVAAADAKLLIVHFPVSYSVHRQDVSRWKHLGVHDVEGHIRFNAEYCQYLNEQRIPCLNITQDLIREAHRNSDRLYYWLDVHWTPKGNQAAAQSVARHLLSHEADFAVQQAQR